MQESLNRIETKIDRVNGKLDDHLARISKLEESALWLKGHVKITLTIAVTVVAGLVTIITKHLLI